MTATQPSSSRRVIWITMLSLALSFALAAATAPYFAERWRTDSPTRFSGTDNFVTQRTQTTFLEAVKAPGLTRQQRREMILEGYRAALADAPFAPFTWREAGAAHYDAGFPEEGRRFLDVARAMDPTNPELRYEIANEILFRDGAAAAFEDYRMALDLDFLGARLAYQHYWRFGYDPLELLETLIPARPAPRRQYLLDALTALPPAKADLVMAKLLPELEAEYRRELDKSAEKKSRPRVPPHLREAGPREPVEVYEGPTAERTITMTLAQSYTNLRRNPTALNFETAAQRREEILRTIYEDNSGPRWWLRPGGADDRAGIGLFNPRWDIPTSQIGPGDWLIPPQSERVICSAGDTPEFKADDPTGWLRIKFDDFGGTSLKAPAQTLMLDGRTSYSLTFSWATRALFTDRPIYLEIAGRARAPINRPRPIRFRSDAMMGERGPNTEQINFYLIDEVPEPITLRVARSTAAEYEPRLRGELWLRFEKLESAPLPPEFIPREVDTETLLRTYDVPNPDLFADWELEALPK